MEHINVTKDSKLIKVLSAQTKGERIDSNISNEVNDIFKTMAENRQGKEIAQTIAFTMDDIKAHESTDLINMLADVKQVNYRETAEFEIKNTGSVQAYIQAKGSTTPRTQMIGDRKLIVPTTEISIRPALNIIDARYGRVNWADLVKECMTEMDRKELQMHLNVLFTAMRAQAANARYSNRPGAVGRQTYPAYAAGLTETSLDNAIGYLRRFGPVAILSDVSKAQKIAGFTGMAINATGDVQRSDNMIDEFNNTGKIGMYKGSPVLEYYIGYDQDQRNPLIDTNWTILLPTGTSGFDKNLKVVHEGTTQSFESQSIDDLTYEMRFDRWVGSAFVTGPTGLPNMAAIEDI